MLVLTFSIVGLLFDLANGLWIGAFLALAVIAFLLKWGEKVVLVFTRARYVTDDEMLVNKVRNFCCHLKLRSINIYWSSAYVNNVYFTDSLFGKPAIVIGRNIYRQFTRNELTALVYASLLRIKSGEAKNRTYTSLLFLIFYSPIFIFKSIFRTSRFHRGFDVFLYPAFSMKMAIHESEAKSIAFDAEVAKFYGLRKDYTAAIFKLSHLPMVGGRNVGGLLAAELVHAQNASDDVLEHLLFKAVDINARMKALNTT